MEKVAEELQAIFQGSDRPPSMQDLAEMKYLERVIKETLRLYPSVPIIGRHVHEDIKVGQKFALLEEKAVISTLLRRYSFRALDKAEDLKLVSELILRPIQGVRVAVQLRKS
ncbi:CSON008890 protein [Gryllus bimaculatus]|nr:CSON008890 protein [Gryllus bimaculatus]